LYKTADAIIFEDIESSNIHQLFLDGKTDEQIKLIIDLKPNTEEKNDEMY
jgi:hypothetical protein